MSLRSRIRKLERAVDKLLYEDSKVTITESDVEAVIEEAPDSVGEEGLALLEASDDQEAVKNALA